MSPFERQVYEALKSMDDSVLHARLCEVITPRVAAAIEATHAAHGHAHVYSCICSDAAIAALLGARRLLADGDTKEGTRNLEAIKRQLASVIHAARTAGPFDASVPALEESLQGAKRKLLDLLGDTPEGTR